MKYIGCMLAFLLVTQAHAAVPAKKTKPQVNKILKGDSVVIGGLAGSGFTLMDVRKTSDAKKKIERIVIDVGDNRGMPMKGLPGYYHAEMQKNPHRLVLDFAQMPNTRIDEMAISNRLKSSMAVKRSAMSLDPIENTLNLTLDLKPNTRARVYQVAGSKTTSKVVIDLITE
ncbi:hypothetical protein D3C87_175260 [compost metagenome]